LLLQQVKPPSAFIRDVFQPSPPPPLAAMSWLDSLSPDRVSFSDAVILLGTAAAVVVLGLRFRYVITKLRLREASAGALQPPVVESEVEMAEEHDAVDEEYTFRKKLADREAHRARIKPARGARDGPPRRPRQGGRSHRRLDEEGDDLAESPARRSAPNRHRAASSRVRGADPRRKAPSHTRPSPAPDDDGPAEPKASPEADSVQSPPAPALPTHYEVLGVDRDASDADLKRAFFRLSRLYHPDKNVGREDETDDLFVQVRQAYETLADPVLRQDYDFELGCL
jgi:DnaJ-domain-containing protein 1